MTYTFDVIHTIDARSNVLLEVMTEHLGLGNGQVFAAIQGALQDLKKILADKGVQYAELKPALVPRIDRHERAYAFDRRRIDKDWYGSEIVEAVLPRLDREATHSILCGDWIHNAEHNDWLCRQLFDELHGPPSSYAGDGCDLFFVYLNNLSDRMASGLDNALLANASYVGYLDLDFTSVMKAFLSTILVRTFIKHGHLILQGHEDDRSPEENVNLVGYDFERFDYEVKSLPSWLYGIFLSYKIERPIFEADDTDTRFSLNAVSDNPVKLDELHILLETRKLQYLQDEKAGSMELAGFAALTSTEIEEQIRSKIKGSYIYNLARAADGQTVKFNIVLENRRVARKECALEYRPAEKQLRLITLY